MKITEISKADAQVWCSQLHYTGSAAGAWFYLMEDGPARAMIAVGRGGNRFGVGDKFGLGGFRGDLEITRVTCAEDAPRNTASRALARLCAHLAKQGVDWLFSYSDTAQGHHGGIYQAVNAVYVGTDAKQWVNFALNGLRVSKRLVSGKYGHTRWPEVQVIAAARGDVLEKTAWMPKLTYILPISANTKARRQIRRILSAHALPYPKRTDDLASLSTPYRNHRPRSSEVGQPAA